MVWDEGEEFALAFFEVGCGGVAPLEVWGFVDAGADGGVGVGDVCGCVPGVVGDDVGGADGVAVGAVDLAWVGEEVGEPLDACGVEAGAVGGGGAVCGGGRWAGGGGGVGGGGGGGAGGWGGGVGWFRLGVEWWVWVTEVRERVWVWLLVGWVRIERWGARLGC